MVGAVERTAYVSRRLLLLLSVCALACEQPHPYPDPLGATGTRCADLASLVKQVQLAAPMARAATLIDGLRARCPTRTPAMEQAMEHWRTGEPPEPNAWEVLCRDDSSVLQRPTGGAREVRLRAAARACDLLATDLFEHSSVQQLADVEGALIGISLYRAMRQQPETLPFAARTIGRWLAGLPDGAGHYVERGLYGEVHGAIGALRLAADPDAEPLIATCAPLWTLRERRLNETQRGPPCTEPTSTILFIDPRSKAVEVLRTLQVFSGDVVRLAGAAQDLSPETHWHDHDRLTQRLVAVGRTDAAPTVLVHAFHTEAPALGLPGLPTDAHSGETRAFFDAVRAAAPHGKLQIEVDEQAAWARVIETLRAVTEPTEQGAAPLPYLVAPPPTP